VNPGDEVVWSNDDTAAHTVTSGTAANGPDGLFDSSLFMAGTTFSHKFDTLGVYDYFCMVHPWMVGQVFVTVGGASIEKDLGTITLGSAVTAPVIQVNDLMAEITTSKGSANEPMNIDVTITDMDGNAVEHITYNVKATQGSQVLMNQEGHMHKGVMTNTHTTNALPFDASETMPVNIIVTSVGFGHDDQYRSAPGEITTKQVVPEFGTIAMMILAISVISILAITAKSQIIPRL
ncbi:MAG: PEFG-CTERM sorting domain-containing protein, partial [Nitrosopumilus sp.]|nr:PEFG-CTERM sorting domain-containing protein [Nitrosopumilus sp.]